MKWVTRERVKVDRVACPWLIRRFIDRDATFLFVPPDQVAAIAKHEGATPFDVEGAELGHHGDRCSFDAFLRRYGLDKDPAMQRLGLIVRGADTNRSELAPEAAGLKAIAHGLAGMGYSDQRLLEIQFPLYDALYLQCGGPAPESGMGVP